MRALLVVALVLFGVVGVQSTASAHGMRTAYVELRELGDGRVHVLVRSAGGLGGVRVVLPEGCDLGDPASATYRCRAPLAGSVVRVEGLGGIVGDAVVTAILRDGGHPSQLLRPGASSWTVPVRVEGISAAARFVRAGAVHVLSGADHLLFLLALVVAMRRFRPVLIAETAFTASHSISMSAAALGWVHVPAAAAEAAIALSLVLVALDVARRRATPPGAGAAMALVFGAVHGLGFAGGLEELGVEKNAILPALGGFAAGVEVAQVAFLLLSFALSAGVARTGLRRRFNVATAYAVGVTGCFWLFDRALPIVKSALG